MLLGLVMVYHINLVLEKYQLFPFLETIINSKLANEGVFQINNKEQFYFNGGDSYFDNVPNNVKFEKIMRKVKAKIKSKF